MNHPTYVGFSILELSKVLMYQFHYEYIKTDYGEASLLFTDTDSLTYQIESDDLYKGFKKRDELFEFFDYLKDDFLLSDVSKNVVGKFKGEFNGKHMHQFINLKANSI